MHSAGIVLSGGPLAALPNLKCSTGCHVNRSDWAGCLATTDWTTVGLWAAASLAAATLLGAAMNRRRQALTDTLTEHVVKTIGAAPGRDNGEANDETGNETVA
jgi:hypothetical protein